MPGTLSGILQGILSLAVLIINRSFFVKGYKSIIHRAPGMDALVSIGAGISYIYSVFLLITKAEGPYFFESAAMIFTLVTLGKALEAESKTHTMDAIKELSELLPSKIKVIRDENEIEISAADIIKDDCVIVREKERIPVDGIIIKGKAVIDKSALTGESLPLECFENDEVISGSMVIDGYVVIKAEKVGSETTLYGIIETVKNAALTKTPIERLADKVSGIFVPVVLGISAITFLIWFISERDFYFALKMAINVLVVSCPCALGLATPTAVMAGTGNAALHKILVKSAGALETAKNVTTVVFDKTGTVTEGKLQVTNICCSSEKREDFLLTMAAVLEKGSSHPYAEAIRNRAVDSVSPKEIMNHELTDYSYTEGRGIEGVIDGARYIIGNTQFMKENGFSVSEFEESFNRFAAEGKTILYLAGEKIYGLFAIADEIKKGSLEGIQRIKELGMDVCLLTGDNEKTAKAIGKKLGIEKVISGVLPNEKHRVIEDLKDKGEIVAMVGDGINDAPALVKADIGIAIGNGTQIAIDSADFILMGNSIESVEYLFRLSKRVNRIIKQNLFWAFFYNVLCIPIAAGALYNIFGISFNPILAAALMSVSSLFVVSNALRLKKE